jgi:pyruvate, water dikinase
MPDSPAASSTSATPDILRFEQIGIGDVAQVGGKNASLGEMISALGGQGIRVPGGFATTAAAYRAFLDDNRLAPPMTEAIERYRRGASTLSEIGSSIRDLFLNSKIPPHLEEELVAAYADLCEREGVDNLAVAVRSSATAEDLPGASFAGQQETFLNVVGKTALLDACRRCFASLFTDRAIAYREAKGFEHLDVALSVGVQRMVRSDLAGSGVIFTIDTETGFPEALVISAAWGLGETVVQGAVEPDNYTVFKPLLERANAEPIIGKTLGRKAVKMVYAEGGSKRTRQLETSPAERTAFVLSNSEILELARWAVAIERHYGRPMDLEWAKDGQSGDLFIVQARPETVHAGQRSALTVFRLQSSGRALTAGAAVGSAIASGHACILRSVADIASFRPGSILVSERTDPDWVPIMRQAAGIVTEHGGTTSHAAIVSRELGVPAIVGTGDATRVIADDQEITLSCAEGETGQVYEGILPFEKTEVEVDELPQTRTKLMINLADPSAAFRWWRLPASGVGLARMEFIINSLIRIHPMALLEPERVSVEDRRQIQSLTRGYEKPADYFIDTLARGIAKLAATFYPKPTIVRLSDFKTNEYARLIGGSAFEPKEENPMLGFRGASRYYDVRYRDGFALECRALKRAREELGFDNIIVMIPFCRTPTEADRVLEVMADNGLKRGSNGLKVYMMCELPSNIVLAEQFARRVDGFSIGSNDLTQLVLGVDRDSDLLASLFDEREEAVRRVIADGIERAHRAGIPVGICGQAPSNYPEFAVFLVEQEIDSISLNPDSFVGAVEIVAQAERARPRKSTKQAAVKSLEVTAAN